MDKSSMPKNVIFSAQMAEKVEQLLSYVDRIFSSGGLNIFAPLMQTDYRILVYLKKNPGAHPSVIADELNVTRPNVAANLRILEEKKYIRREMDAENRRQIYVHMTKEGEEHLARVGTKLDVLFASWLSILGEEETEHLFKILDLSSDPKLITADLRKISYDD